MAWALIEIFRDGKVTAVGMATEAVAVFVGITPAAGFISPASGVLIGTITSSFCYVSVKLKIKLSFDD